MTISKCSMLELIKHVDSINEKLIVDNTGIRLVSTEKSDSHVTYTLSLLNLDKKITKSFPIYALVDIKTEILESVFELISPHESETVEYVTERMKFIMKYYPPINTIL